MTSAKCLFFLLSKCFLFLPSTWLWDVSSHSETVEGKKIGALTRGKIIHILLCPKTIQITGFTRMFLLNQHYSTYFSTIKWAKMNKWLFLIIQKPTWLERLVKPIFSVTSLNKIKVGHELMVANCVSFINWISGKNTNGCFHGNRLGYPCCYQFPGFQLI